MKDRIKSVPTREGAVTASAADEKENLLRGDEQYRKACRLMSIGYAAAGLLLAVFYGAQQNWYLMAQSLGTIAALLAIFAVLKLLKIKPVYSLYAVIIAFTFAAYTLGVACALYKITPLYDKILHMLSGTFVMMLSPALFYTLKSGHTVEKSDCALAVCFCVLTSLAVAGVWELAEYFISLTAGIDPQNVLSTGVADTMQDMIVCTIGTLLAVPPLIEFYKTGRAGILYTGALVYIEKNLR